MTAVRTTRASLPHMQSGSAIVNVSSTAAKRPSAGMPDYSVLKAALLSFSRLVADLHAADGIRCNAVTPGPTATDAWLGAGGLAEQQGERDEVLAKVAAGPAARPPRRAGRDRGRDRVPPVPAGRVRDGRGLVGRRRNGADHHLIRRLPWLRARRRRESRRRLRRAHSRAGGEHAVAARRALLRDAPGGRTRRTSAASARRFSAIATASSTRSRSGA